jgi:hypothetical protein
VWRANSSGLRGQARSLPKVYLGIVLTRKGSTQLTAQRCTVNRLLSVREAHGLVNSGYQSVTITEIRALRKVFEEI